MTDEIAFLSKSQWVTSKGNVCCYYDTKLHLPDCGIFSRLSTNASLCEIGIFILIYDVALNVADAYSNTHQSESLRFTRLISHSHLRHRRALGIRGQRPEWRTFAMATSFLIHTYWPSLIMSFEWVVVMQKIDGKSGKRLAQVSQQGHEVEGEWAEPN